MMNEDKEQAHRTGEISDVLPIHASPPSGTEEHRNENRYRASWKIFVSIEGTDLQEGKIKDVSLHGAAILNERNLMHGTHLTLPIHIPSLMGYGVPRIRIVKCRTSYSIHDADNICFRVGVKFVEFNKSSDRAYLEARLTRHHSKV
ncbi:MAG: PilZ domain-containing protein [Gallionella sp.]